MVNLLHSPLASELTVHAQLVRKDSCTESMTIIRGLASLLVTMIRMRSSSLVPRPAIASCNRLAKNRGLYLATSTAN